MKVQSYAFWFCIGFIVTTSAWAQAPSQPYSAYIDQYNKLAVKHMKQYRIPASIKLAQGILETGGGRSDFVKKTNNHFGMKCHADWAGDRVYKADDSPNDCFRSYRKVEDSFEDHSRFLTGRRRYAELFTLDITDYRGWARGLQHCGYATDRSYATKLIQIIENYELYLLDEGEKKYDTPVDKFRRVPYKAYGLVYVIAEENDSYAKIARDIGCKMKDLLKYNDVPEQFTLRAGDIVYLEKKKKQADKPYFEHIVQVGESMHSISQQYAVQLKRLYKLNKKDYNYVLKEGDILRLR